LELLAEQVGSSFGLVTRFCYGSSDQDEELSSLIGQLAQLDEWRQKQLQQPSWPGDQSVEPTEGRVKELSWTGVLTSLLDLRSAIATKYVVT
jgi:hypothetical protein